MKYSKTEVLNVEGAAATEVGVTKNLFDEFGEYFKSIYNVQGAK